MKNYTYLLVLFFSCFLPCCKKESPVSAPENHPPAIQSLSSTPSTSSSIRIPYRGSVLLTVTALDPDGDQLTYVWKADQGSFPKGNLSQSVEWDAPDSVKGATYPVSVSVSDAKTIVAQSISIYVATAIAGLSVYPSTVNFGTSINSASFSVFNTGDTPLNWAISNIPSWISCSPQLGLISKKSDSSVINVTLSRTLLSAGQNTATITVTNTNQTTQLINVSIIAQKVLYGSLSGNVYYSGTTVPVSGATVTCNSKNYTTDNTGSYTIDSVAVGIAQVTVTKDGYDSFSRSITINNGTNNFNVSMTSALYTHKVYGIITSSRTLQPIQNVAVTFLNPDGSDSQLRTISDYLGNYQIPTVPQGNRRIRFYESNHDTSYANIFIANIDYLFNVQLYPKTYNLGGTYNSDLSLTSYNSPYFVVGNITMLNGAKLSIGPGTRIFVKGEYQIQGRVMATGTSSSPITITSSDTMISPIKWKGLQLFAYSSLSNVEIAYADTGFNIINNSPYTSISDCVIRNCSSIGILISSDNCTVTRCSSILNGRHGIKTINDNPNTSIQNCIVNANQGVGILVQGSLSNINNSSITNNGENGIWITTGTVTSIDGCDIGRNAEGVYIGRYSNETTFGPVIVNISNTRIRLQMFWGVVVYNSGSVNITHCNIDSCHSGIYALYPVNITKCNIRWNTGAEVYAGVTVAPGVSYFVSQSNIYSNSSSYYPIFNLNATVFQYPTTQGNAQNNWWGNDDIPVSNDTRRVPYLSTPVSDAGPQ